MKFRNFIIIFIMAILLFSCNKKKENNIDNIKKETEQVGIQKPFIENEENRNNYSNKYYALDDEMRESIKSKITATEEEKEAMKKFLYKNDEYIIKYKVKIIFIEKANFGIPGGDNWIVLLNDDIIFFYVIIGDKIEKRYNDTSFEIYKYSDFDIMQEIPGTHIGNTTSSFGDFNGDGIDEIFQYGFYGRAFIIRIAGYNVKKDDIIADHDDIPFGLIDKVNGPAPVEFLTYKGMLGFKVYYFNPEVAGGEGWVPDPDPNNGKWIFYTWDAEKRTYIEIGEIIE